MRELLKKALLKNLEMANVIERKIEEKSRKIDKPSTYIIFTIISFFCIMICLFLSKNNGYIVSEWLWEYAYDVDEQITITNVIAKNIVIFIHLQGIYFVVSSIYYILITKVSTSFADDLNIISNFKQQLEEKINNIENIVLKIDQSILKDNIDVVSMSEEHLIANDLIKVENKYKEGSVDSLVICEKIKKYTGLISSSFLSLTIMMMLNKKISITISEFFGFNGTGFFSFILYLLLFASYWFVVVNYLNESKFGKHYIFGMLAISMLPIVVCVISVMVSYILAGIFWTLAAFLKGLVYAVIVIGLIVAICSGLGS